MAILGFIFTCGILLMVGLFLLAVAWNGLGEYTIGGSNNTTIGRFFIIAAIIGYFYLWSLAFKYSPFVLIIN